jgi:hypothetical protein
MRKLPKGLSYCWVLNSPYQKINVLSVLCMSGTLQYLDRRRRRRGTHTTKDRLARAQGKIIVVFIGFSTRSDVGFLRNLPLEWFRLRSIFSGTYTGLRLASYPGMYICLYDKQIQKLCSIYEFLHRSHESNLLLSPHHSLSLGLLLMQFTNTPTATQTSLLQYYSESPTLKLPRIPSSQYWGPGLIHSQQKGNNFPNDAFCHNSPSVQKQLQHPETPSVGLIAQKPAREKSTSVTCRPCPSRYSAQP